jgi:hypothetical protein
MRKKSFLLAAMTAVLISSCSHDSEVPVTDGGNATLKLTVSGASAVTRATGAALHTKDEENVITNVTVGLFDHTTGKTDVISEGSLTDKVITINNATAGDRDIIVVANAPSGKFAGALTKDEFRKRALSLTQVKTLLPMSGESAAAVTLVGGVTKDASVEVSRLVSRIQITSLKTDFSTVGQYANASFTLDKVFLYNAMSTSQVGVISPAELVTDLPVHGWIGTNEVGEIKNASLLDMDINKPIPAAPSVYTTPYYFYAFQNYFAAGIDNTNKETATKLVVAGWFKANSTSTAVYVYYPAVINRAQAGTNIVISDGSTVSNKGIVRNSIYSVAATIKSIGVDSPEKFMEPAGLNLTVTISDWKFTASQVIDF